MEDVCLGKQETMQTLHNSQISYYPTAPIMSVTESPFTPVRYPIVGGLNDILWLL